MPNAVVTLTLQSQAAALIRQTANETKALTAAEQRATQQAAARLASEQRLATALGQTAVQEQRRATETARTAKEQANASAASARAEQAALRLAQSHERAAGSTKSFADQIGSALTSNLLGMVGPAALVATAIGTLVGTANSFKEAFTFKAQLDQSTASIAVQLAGVRSSSQTFAEAARFANTYKLTQQETTEAIRASLPVIRASKASTDEILGTLARLRVLNPEQDFAGAARALGELKAGQVVSIVDRFNIARSSANAMKKEIEGGADAVLVLSKYLDSAGVGMDALKTGTVGAAGAIKDLAIAQERLKLAQAGFIQGPGTNFLNAASVGITDLANALGGNSGGGLGGALTNNIALLKANVAAGVAFNAALAQSGSIEKAVAVAAAIRGQVYRDNAAVTQTATTETIRNADANTHGADAYAAAKPPLVALNLALADGAIEAANAKVKAAELTNAQSALADIGGAVKSGLITSGEGAAILAANLQLPIDKARELLALQAQIANDAGAVQRAIARANVSDVGKKDIDVFGLPSDNDKKQSAQIISDANTASQLRAQQRAAQITAAQQAAAEAKKIADAQLQLDLARAKTSAEKIAIYRRQLATTTDKAEQLRIQAQIAQEQQSGARASKADPNAKGLGALAQDDIKLADDLAGQLAEVNAQLSRGNLTTHQRNQLLIKQRDLEEKISEEKNKQYKASLDAQELAIRDRQQDRDDAKDLRIANAILSNPNANADLKARAADKAALIGIQDAKRALELDEKGATAGGAPFSAPPAQPGGVAPTAPLSPTLPGTANAGGAPSTQAIVLQLVDGGRVLAETIDPFVMDRLLSGIRQVRATKGA